MRQIGVVVTIVVLLFVTLFPVLWTLLSSFKTLKDIVTPVPTLLFEPTWQNYAAVLATPSVQHGLANSAIVVGCSLAARHPGRPCARAPRAARQG